MSQPSQDPLEPARRHADQVIRHSSSVTESGRARAVANARTIETGEGEWRVYELECGQYDRRAGPSLIFESDGVLRRVRDYPSDWRELSDAELMQVSWHR